MIPTNNPELEVQFDAQFVINEINSFTFQTFNTRGGRLGSGMGSLIEAIWGYYMNRILRDKGRLCEIAWLQDHEPADFACLMRGAEWDPSSRRGELFRIEAKSMNIGVDEAKGHFTNLRKETNPHDQLLVLLWSWETVQNQYIGSGTTVSNKYSWPRIHDYFLGPAIPVIELRDALHIQRGGSFVDSQRCPDHCYFQNCTHLDEPLNSLGRRERRSGPKNCKPPNVEYAANFGGLIRMLKTDNDSARVRFRELRRANDVAHRYISFIHKNYPSEEINQYKKGEWQKVLSHLGLPVTGQSSEEANRLIRQYCPNYQETLRDIF